MSSNRIKTNKLNQNIPDKLKERKNTPFADLLKQLSESNDSSSYFEAENISAIANHPVPESDHGDENVFMKMIANVNNKKLAYDSTDSFLEDPIDEERLKGIYEKNTKKIPGSHKFQSKEEGRSFRERQLKEKLYGHVKSKVFDSPRLKISSENTKEDSKAIDPHTESPSDTRTKKNIKSRLLLVDRLYTLEQEKQQRLKEKRQRKLADEEDKLQNYFTPKIDSASKRIAKKLPKSIPAYERLFYQGIESSKLKEQQAEEEFLRKYTFHPNIELHPYKISTMDKKRIEEIYKRLTGFKKERELRLEEKRYYSNNFDSKTKQRLFKPRITHSENIESLEDAEIERVKEKMLKKTIEFCNSCYCIYKAFLDEQKISKEKKHNDVLYQLIELIVKQHGEEEGFEHFYLWVFENGYEEGILEIANRIKLKQDQDKKAPFKV